MINKVYHLLVKNESKRGGGGLIEREGLINFLALKRGSLLEGGGLFESGA